MWPKHPESKFPPLPLIEGEKVLEHNPDQTKLTTQLTERAVSFIERNKDRPFFFYLAHSMPHVPLFVSSKFKGKSQQGLYGDVIMEIDWSVGQVMQTLAKHGLERDTLVIFTTDNGPWLSYGNHAGSAGPLREGKGTAWEGGTRVPCVMRWPGKIPAGAVSNDYFMTIDLLPTIAQRVGAKLPSLPIDGMDVWPLVAQQSGAKNPHEGYGLWYAQNELQAVVTGDGRWKLVLPHRYRTLAGRPGGRDGVPAKYENTTTTEPQLYDLQTDVGEKSDVAAANPEIVKRLLAFAEKCREDLGDSLTKRSGKGAREPGRVAAATTK
jgi:arylsulfatase